MRTKILPFAIFILALVGLCAAYFIGYGRGHTAAVRDQTKFGLVNYLALYKFEQDGNTNRLNSWLRFLVFTHSDYYDRYFSNETVADTNFLKHLEEARAIASIVRTQVVTFD